MVELKAGVQEDVSNICVKGGIEKLSLGSVIFEMDFPIPPLLMTARFLYSTKVWQIFRDLRTHLAHLLLYMSVNNY